MLKNVRRSIMVGLVLVLSLSGCGSSEVEKKEPVDSKTVTEVVVDEKEAPMLAELVEKGELVPLAERIPIEGDVMIEPDIIELGQYGGSMKAPFHDAEYWGWGALTEQSLFRFKQDGSGEVEANICKDYYPNEDSTVWTVELREGMKWSDGEPLTADDFEFYYNHMSVPALNEDRSPVDVESEDYYNAFTTKPYRAYYVVIDEVNYWAEFNKIDDYKFTMTYKVPKPNYPEAVAIDNKWAVAPKHFFKDLVSRKDGITDDAQFPFITEEEAVANANRIVEKDFDSYSTMGKEVGYYIWKYYQVPQLRSFIATNNNWDKVGETYELVRNPYFFKVDSEGRQLPYLDSIQIEVINEEDQKTLKATAGEFDYYPIDPREFTTVVTATQDTHQVVKWASSEWGRNYSISLNQSIKDLDKRELFQNKDFRQALSIAVDRNLLNATLTNEQAEPWQLSPGEGMLGYDAEWSTKWTEYDQDKANELLDALTEPWDRKDGTYRKMKGTDKDVVLNFTLGEDQVGEMGDFIGLLTTAYKSIGVRVLDKVSSEVAHMILSNEHEVTMDDIFAVSPAIRPDMIVPMRNFSGWYGAYGKWYEDNKSTANGGMEPTGDMLALINAYEAMITATGDDRDDVIAKNSQAIYNLHKENIWILGFLSPIDARHLVGNTLKNFPEETVNCDEFRWGSVMRPEQLYKID